MWYIHTVEYYLTIKWNKLMIDVTAWIILKSIMLNERSLAQEYILYESHRYHAEQKKPDKKGETQMIPFMQAK